MDAELYAKEFKRMCHCENCGFLHDLGITMPNDCEGALYDYPEKATAIVEQWSKEHPIQTNRQKVEEMFGRRVNIKACPPFAPEEWCRGECIECEKWWDAPYEAPKED